MMFDSTASKLFTSQNILKPAVFRIGSTLKSKLNLDSIHIDYDGYVVLLDLNSLKFVKSRTYTILNDPHFLAPEVCLGEGFNYMADYWALGIIMYYLIYKKPPFTCEDPFLLYKRIISGSIKWNKEENELNDKKVLSIDS